MRECILKDTGIAPDRRRGLQKTLAGWHARSCAAFIGAATLLSLALPGEAKAQAPAPTRAEAEHHHDHFG